MKVSVEFCMQWNYAPKAASFAQELFEKVSTKIEKLELIPSSGGVFEVEVDGEIIHSKKETGVFPNLDEILKTLNI